MSQFTTTNPIWKFDNSHILIGISSGYYFINSGGNTVKLKECFVFKVKLNTTTAISVLLYPQYCTVFSSILSDSLSLFLVFPLSCPYLVSSCSCHHL